MSNRRIAFNVLASYGQTLLSLTLGVFSIRWIYLALGKENYGLFAAVGAILGFVGIFNSILNHSNTRFFALAIGEGRKRGPDYERRELLAWFNAAFSVHLLFATVMCGLMFVVGEHLIRHGTMIIPEGMERDSLIVFRISLLVMFLTVLHMPFNALYTARQLIFVRNATGMVQTFLVAAEAWWILHYDGDRFLAHGVLFSSITVLVYAILVGLAIRAFPECRLRTSLWFDRKRVAELASYSMYAFFDAIGGCLHGSGFNLVVNANFGPVANAVIGIGSRVSGKLNMLSGAIASAIAPEITSRVGATDVRRAERMSILACFLTALPVCFAGVPCMFWIKEILGVFLVDPPEGSATVVVLLLVTGLLERMTLGLKMLVLASGRVRGLQLTSAFLKASSMLVLWCLLRAQTPFLPAVGIAWILPQIGIAASRIWFAHRLLRIDRSEFVRSAAMPILLYLGVTLAFGSVFRLVAGPSFWWIFPFFPMNAGLILALILRTHPDPTIRELPRRVALMIAQRLPVR